MSDSPPTTASGKWAVVDIGCLECGEASSVFGVYDDVEQAREALVEYADTLEKSVPEGRDYFGYFTGGQHSVQILEVGA